MTTTPPSDRRAFMKKFALAAGAATVLRAPAFARTLGEQKPRRAPLGIALVGLGYYATDLLAPALQQTEHVKLTGIVTGTPAKADRWMRDHGIPQANVYDYETFDRIADNDAIDVIYVVLPNSMHHEYVIRAAQAGKHVITEKPMGVTARECEEMIQACEDAGVRLSVGYRMQFEPNTQEVMRLGQEQVFGPVKMVQAGAGYREGRADHWKLKKAMGGGALYDMGVYALQAARYVTGEEPVAVTAQQSTTRPELFTEVDETMRFQLEFPSGALASLYTSFGMNVNDLYATAERGWFALRPFSSYSGIQGASSNGPLDAPPVNQQARQLDEQALSIIENTPMRVPGEEGLRDLRVVEAIYQSAAEAGRRVEVQP